MLSGESGFSSWGGNRKNMPFYPLDRSITAIDLRPRMLERARKKTKRMGLDGALYKMDV
jgi:ubiquinone/menaquinone biosynthesis C-methylase UbiE